MVNYEVPVTRIVLQLPLSGLDTSGWFPASCGANNGPVPRHNNAAMSRVGASVTHALGTQILLTWHRGILYLSSHKIRCIIEKHSTHVDLLHLLVRIYCIQKEAKD